MEKLRPVIAPDPLRVTFCGLPIALSVIVTFADRFPAAVGVKVTPMLQLAPAATEPPQLFVWAKSPLLVPVTAILLMLSAVLPVLVRVTVCAALVVPTFSLPNVRPCRGKGYTGIDARPCHVDQLRTTSCGVSNADVRRFSATVGLGVNWSVIVQLAPAAYRWVAGIRLKGKICRVGPPDNDLAHSQSAYCQC